MRLICCLQLLWRIYSFICHINFNNCVRISIQLLQCDFAHVYPFFKPRRLLQLGQSHFYRAVGTSASGIYLLESFERTVEIYFHSVVYTKRTYASYGVSHKPFHVLECNHLGFCRKSSFILPVIDFAIACNDDKYRTFTYNKG